MNDLPPNTDPPEPRGDRIVEALGRIEHRIVAIAAWAIVVFLLFWFFSPFKMVLLGFLAAACLSSALRPLVRKLPGPRGVRGMLVGFLPPLLLAGLVTLVVWLLAEPVQTQIAQWPKMEQQINAALAGWSKQLGLGQPLQVQSMLSQLDNLVTGSGGKELFSTTTGIVTSLLIAVAFVFIGSIYLLIEPPQRLLTPLLALFPAHRRPEVQSAFIELGPSLRWWLIGTALGALIIGVASWIGYALVGLPFSLPLAILAGIGEMIPTIGPILTFLVALVFAATQGVSQVVGVSVVYLVVQGLESYLIVPFVMKKAVNMPPIVTLFTIVLWGKIFGPAGLFLAIPLNLVTWTFARHLIAHEDKPAPSA